MWNTILTLYPLCTCTLYRVFAARYARENTAAVSQLPPMHTFTQPTASSMSPSSQTSQGMLRKQPLDALPQLNIVYDLPGSISSTLHKQTILDPESHKQYHLPTTSTSKTLEKLTPALINPAPKLDPHHLETVIRNGGDVTMRLLSIVKIRKMMHRRHRRKRRAERDFFLLKRVNFQRAKKREKEMRATEKQWQAKAAEWSPREFLEAERATAVYRGWTSNDVFETLKRLEKGAGKSGDNRASS